MASYHKLTHYCYFCKQTYTSAHYDMKDFAAIDFETANGQRSSICSVGLVVVRDGK